MGRSLPIASAREIALDQSRSSATVASCFLLFDRRAFDMPTESMLMLAAVVAFFTIFAVVVAWGDRQTRRTHW